MSADVLPLPPAERTFRDPAGYVELREDAVYRFLAPEFAGEVLDFLQSPLAGTLVSQGRLVSSEVLSADGTHLAHLSVDSGTVVLRHPLIPFASYPWEWPPALWLAAAELTLNLCRDLLKDGWILKDATPLNVLFRGVEPVLVDVPSVARVDRSKPIWFAYGQFVRTFLLPMIAHTSLGWPLRSTLLRRDGYEPEELYAALPLSSRMQQPALTAVTLPCMLGKARPGAASTAAVKAPRAADPEVTEHVLRQTFTRLLKAMHRAAPAERSSKWTAYSGTATHYSEADHARKRAFIVEALERSRPERVLDVGCNAGVYSQLAAEAGAYVVGIDTDQQTLDQLCARLKGTGLPIHPLLVNLANPTPAVGWANRESASFLHRSIGFFDGVIMLAVLHHLLLHDHVPMAEVARLCSKLTTRTLIIEWVPPTDVMFHELVRGRETIFASITEGAFREHFGPHFTIVTEHVLENGRVLFHLERRHEG